MARTKQCSHMALVHGRRFENGVVQGRKYESGVVHGGDQGNCGCGGS